MEEIKVTTTTETQTKTEETNKDSINELANNAKYVVKAPLFLMFAEYLGFVSKVIDWADEWCNGKKQEDYKVKIIETDAICLLNQMKKKYSDKEIAEWYDEFYDVILSDYEDNLISLETKK